MRRHAIRAGKSKNAAIERRIHGRRLLRAAIAEGAGRRQNNGRKRPAMKSSKRVPLCYSAAF
jgi:hypothetical protein